MKKKILVIFFCMLLICSSSVTFANENENLEEETIEQSSSLTKITDVSDVENNFEDDNEYSPLMGPPTPSWYSFKDAEWNVLVVSSEWGNIGKLNQQMFVYKLKYDESESYDWYNFKWIIQSVPGIILWSDNDWRTDKIDNWADCDAFDSYVELVDYGPYGDHGSHTIGVEIGVTAGENGAEVTCMLSWSYTQEDFMQFDYSDFSDELVKWCHDDMEDNLMQSITVEPGFTIRVPQQNDWTIHFKTHAKYVDPFPWNPVTYYFTQKLTWEWSNWDHNYKPDKPMKPSGATSGETDTSYTFSTESYDGDCDDILYEFRWDDGKTDQTGWKDSGDTATLSHSWSSPGTYEIQVRAKDKQGAWSDWSQIHAITIKDSCCFPAGTKITLADGSVKNIEDVKVGDRVLSYNVKRDKFTSWTVKMLGNPIHPVYEINDGLISATVDHPFYIQKSDDELGWGAIDPVRAKKSITYRGKILPLEVGDKLYTEEGEWIEITSVKSSEDPVQTYNLLSYSGMRTYFANGILVYEEHPPFCITNYLLKQFFERFPNAFPILRQLLGL